MTSLVPPPDAAASRSSLSLLISRERHVLSQLVRGVPLAQVLDDLLRAVEAYSTERMLTSVLLLSDDGAHLVHGAAPSLPAAYNQAIDGMTIGEGQGSCGTVSVRRTPVYVSDIATDPLWQDFRELALSHDLAACWSTPIKGADDTLLGTFAIYYSAPRSPTADDIEAIDAVTQTAALAIERHRSDQLIHRNQMALQALNADLERQVSERAYERGKIWNVGSDLLCVVDLESKRFDRVNPAWPATLGWSADELEGTPYLEFLHPDDVAASGNAYASLRRGEPILRYENRYRHRDGGYRTLSWVAVPDGAKIYSRGIDVTEEKQQARLLAERTADRDALWQLTRDLMLRCTFEGVVIAINPAWTEILGWAQSELIGSSLLDLIHPDDVAPSLAGAKQLADGQRYVGFDNRYRHKDGRYRWISWSISADQDGVIATGRDATREREQAEALEKAEEALRQSQKMEAVGQLTGGLAHDFNNLLAGISGSLEMATMRIAQGRVLETDKFLLAAQGATKRAAALTHRLLAFSRRQTLDPKAIQLNTLIKGMEELVRRTVGPSVNVDCVFGSGNWPVLVDPNQLENALLNLCINARDAMPNGGNITIETANRRFDERSAKEQDIPPGQYVSMCVSDNGVGMPPEVIARAFEPFFTTKPIGLGTGLGLSMIYGFVRQSGGHVRIYSEVGSGTMVCLYLPRHLAEIGVADEPTGTPIARPGIEDAGMHVLVIDDEPLVRMLIVDVLTDLGYTVSEAEDGPSGLSLLDSNRKVDLLITDVGLPNGMNGRQVADAARMKRPDLKVLFVTGYAENAVLNHGHLAPGMHVVTKPFHIDDLVKRVTDITAER